MFLQICRLYITLYVKHFLCILLLKYRAIFPYGDDNILYISNGENFIHTNKISHNRPSGNSKWITLNVGGRCFTTTRNTLTKKEPTSMLARYTTFFK